MSADIFKTKMLNTKHPLTKKLFKIIIEKKTNLCLAADFHTLKELVDCVDDIGEHICLLKTHCNYFRDCKDVEEIGKIFCNLKEKHNILIFEDAKFCEGKEQIKNIYRNWYLSYADFVTVTGYYGPGIFEAIREVVAEENQGKSEDNKLVRGCLSVVQVSFRDIAVKEFDKLYAITKQHTDICVGIIAQDFQIEDGVDLIKLSPGVHISEKRDGGGNQAWQHPDQVVKQGADVLIVGRGITQASKCDRKEIAIKYKNAGFLQ